MHLIDNALLRNAPGLLQSAATAIGDRAALRDQPSGERSMARAVATFNAMYGQQLTEQQGWQFMVLLKMARSASGRMHPDDFIDQASYSALAGECAIRSDLHAELSEMAHSPHCAGHSKPYAPT